MEVLGASGLPDGALDASAAFFAHVLPQARAACADGDVCIVFDPADHTHKAWRLAAVQSLAREAAPGRVNAVASGDDAAIAAALDYLARAPGVTGQLFALDGQGAGNPAG